MLHVMDSSFANPSAIHEEGVAARRLIDDAREKLARTLGVRAVDVTFTGSGTESNNLAILGAVEARHTAGVAYADMQVITTPIEHPSIAMTMQALAARGVQVVYLPVNAEGKLTVADLAAALTPQTVLVAFALVNSEIGVIQPAGALARAVRAYERTAGTRVTVHLDAAQAPLWLSCELGRYHVDTIALDAGKCNGPKGVGVLARRHGVALKSIMHGGPQEHDLRPATENVVGIVGAAEAIVLAQAAYETRATAVARVRDAGIELLTKLPGVVLNGSPDERVANNINISIPGLDSEYAVIVLDAAGIAASTKSACSGATTGGSSVVRAISGDDARANSTIRLTLGDASTIAEISHVRDVLKEHIDRMTPFSAA